MFKLNAECLHDYTRVTWLRLASANDPMNSSVQIRMSVGSVRLNVVDALPCRCQSFRQVWNKSAVDFMRNVTNVQKSPIPQWWRKWKSDAVSTRGSGFTSKSWWLLDCRPLPITPATFVCVCCLFQFSFLAVTVSEIIWCPSQQVKGHCCTTS